MATTTSTAAAPAGGALRNAMTVDVEDYFQVADLVPRSRWTSLPCRIERNVDIVLSLLAQNQVRATFFTLGWIARRYPGVVRAIVGAGHELASHGYSHHLASQQSRTQFRRDVIRSKYLLEDLGGCAVSGYRAPGFSIGPDSRWALDTLYHTGYRYSSSTYPAYRDAYATPNSPRFAFFPSGPSGILELPVSTVRILQRNLPAGGARHFRLYPYCLSRWCLRRVNLVDKQAGIFYFHPWELDPGQPRPERIAMKLRLAHYRNLNLMEGRLLALTRDFRWDRIDNIFPVLP